jgi:hypothetical protein
MARMEGPCARPEAGRLTPVTARWMGENGGKKGLDRWDREGKEVRR